MTGSVTVRPPDSTDTHHALARSFSLGPRALRRSWVLATALGETLGFLVPGLVAVVAFDLHPAYTLVLMVIAGCVEGAVLGAAQSVVLAREFLGFSRGAWIFATAMGAAAAWFVGMLPSTFYPAWTDWPASVLVPAGLLLGLTLLTTIGLAQWTVLRRHVARARTWVPANAVAWMLGLGLLFAVTTPLWQEGQSPALVVGIGILGGLVMALTVAVVTGLWLGRITRARPAGADTRPAPPGVPEDDWRALAEPTDRFRVFDPTTLEDLPEPVRRWLLHAITPGAALLTGVEAEWSGHLRLRGSWRAFCSRQRATMDGGFVWAATTRLGGLPVSGFDRFTRGQGEMRWRLLRRLPLVSEEGDQVTRSAAGRHAVELFAAVPAVALAPQVRWEPVDQRRATAYLDVGGEQQAVTVSVDPVGRLRQVEMDRWGRPPGEPYDLHRFGAVLAEERRFGARFGRERRFDGYLVPTQVVGGWHLGTDRWDDGAFLRYRVVRCSFH